MPNLRGTLLHSLLSSSLLLFTGCSGGGGDDSTTTAAAVAPSSLSGSVVLLNYSDSRSYALTFTSTRGSGVSRSDGRTSTAWNGSGYETAVLSLELAYGAYSSQSSNNIVDRYMLTFSSQKSGTFTLRENTTANSASSSALISGTFTFTTYPANSGSVGSSVAPLAEGNVIIIPVDPNVVMPSS